MVSIVIAKRSPLIMILYNPKSTFHRVKSEDLAAHVAGPNTQHAAILFVDR